MLEPEQQQIVSENLISHLVELRNRLIKIVIANAIIFLVCVPFAQNLYHLLAVPLLTVLPKGAQMIATEVTTPFFVPMKVAMMTAFLTTLPVTFYQIWAFIAPGLYEHEKRLISPLLISSILLFVSGMAFAYFVVFPIVFTFITSTAPEGVTVMTDINKYLDFVLGSFVTFGITFEVPIFVILLIRTGIIELKKLQEIRPYIIVAAFVVGAIFTPPDVLSQLLMAIPLWLLYEVGLFLGRWFQPTPQEVQEAVKTESVSE